MNFWNTNVLSERSEDIKLVSCLISQEFPWIWGYTSQKHITIGAPIFNSTPVEEPDWEDSLYAFKALELANGAENLPFPKLFVFSREKPRRSAFISFMINRSEY